MYEYLKRTALIIIAISLISTGCRQVPSQHPHEISVNTAFRMKGLGDGIIGPDKVCFYEPNDTDPVAHFYLIEDILNNDPVFSVPHARYYEKYLSEEVKDLLPVIEFALEHGYTRFCLPSCELNYGVFMDNIWFLDQMYMYRMNALEVSSFTLDNGEVLRYMLITILDVDNRDTVENLAALEKARDIVGGMPACCDSDKLKALYLYNYLTDNVKYDSNNYYGSEVDFAYDALVKHSTVCAGYAMALFYLFNMAGIDCIYLCGYMDSASGSWHAWNAAGIDGDYYLFDATWDEGNDICDYRFFGISYDAMQKYKPRSMVAKVEEYHPVCDKMIDIKPEAIPQW